MDLEVQENNLPCPKFGNAFLIQRHVMNSKLKELKDITCSCSVCRSIVKFTKAEFVNELI